MWTRGIAILFRLVDLVKKSAICEVRLLCRFPATENIIHADQRDLRKKIGILREQLLGTRPEIRAHRQLLSLVRPEILEIVGGQLTRAAPVARPYRPR